MSVEETIQTCDATTSEHLCLGTSGRNPSQRVSKSDVYFPLSTPRRRAPSVTSLADIVEKNGPSFHLTIRAGAAPVEETEDVDMPDESEETEDTTTKPRRKLHDLPPEVQGKILDFIFGDMHSINAGSTSLRGKSVASLMRHPRRKAVSDFALICPLWREMVQERIYRHIKIKGTRPGIDESVDFFCEHSHLTQHVRHIEFWVPVWGDKASLMTDQSIALQRQAGSRFPGNPLRQIDEALINVIDPLGLTFPLSAQTATLSEIFSHIACFFTAARVFTLEGGHCKKSNMIRHFSADRLFEKKEFEKLPHIRTFAMRGAWNIMRSHKEWENIVAALPNVEEWHCGYAKPRVEAEEIMNEIFIHRPTFRHINISLDGMYSKDPSTLGSGVLPLHPKTHLCENMGQLLPTLESLSFTGKICECMWKSAITTLQGSKEESKLQHLEIVVKSCCRQRVTSVDPVTGEIVVDELGGVMADGAGITNLTFIRAFERLVLNTVEALRWFRKLDYVRIRFIDLDSPCTLLNPYWMLEKGKVFGIWSEEIVERLNEVRPEVRYTELGDGIEGSVLMKTEDSPGGTQSLEATVYPRSKPKSIQTSAYRVIADAVRS